MKTRGWVVAVALISAGAVLIAAGLRRADFEAPPLEDVAGVPTEISAQGELAMFILREGRKRLRSGMLGPAADAAKLAGLLDPKSGAQSLAAAVDKRRGEMIGSLREEIEDAHSSGEAVREARAISILERIVEGEF